MQFRKIWGEGGGSAAVYGSRESAALQGLVRMFVVVLAAKTADDVADSSVNKPSTQLLFQPMPAAERVPAQALATSVVEPVAVGLTGLALILLQAIGETNENGDVRVFFELNGQPRTVRVPDRKAQAKAPKRPKAETGNPNQVAAPMPGVIASVAVKDGQPVQPGDLMLTIEAMKMETGLYADRAGTVKALHVQPGSQVDAKDLLVELEPAT